MSQALTPVFLRDFFSGLRPRIFLAAHPTRFFVFPFLHLNNAAVRHRLHRAEIKIRQTLFVPLTIKSGERRAPKARIGTSTTALSALCHQPLFRDHGRDIHYRNILIDSGLYSFRETG